MNTMPFLIRSQYGLLNGIYNIQKKRNTLFQGLFVANFFFFLISNKCYEEIELTTFHNLAGRDFGGSVFQKKR